MGGEPSLGEPFRIVAGGVGADTGRGGAAQQRVDRLPFGPAEEIPEGEVDAAEGHDGDAAASVRDRGCVQLVPEALDVGGAVAGFVQQQFAQVAVDHRHGGHTAAATAVAADAGVGFDAHDDLPEVGAPAAQRLAIVRVYGLHVGDFHVNDSAQMATRTVASGPVSLCLLTITNCPLAPPVVGYAATGKQIVHATVSATTTPSTTACGPAQRGTSRRTRAGWTRAICPRTSASPGSGRRHCCAQCAPGAWRPGGGYG